MKRRLSELLLGIAALSSLCSCETKPITDDYDIVKRDCLKEEKIAQLTPTMSAKAFDSISVYPSWEFVEPLFFTKDCPFTKKRDHLIQSVHRKLHQTIYQKVVSVRRY